MTFRPHLAACALLAAGIGSAAAAAEFVTVPVEATINAPAAVAWKTLSGYCAIGAWLKTSCVITSGQDGEMGAVRRIADRVDELLVARTAWSYTYAQPKSPIDYHGTVEIQPIDKRHARLLYTLVYDAEPLATPEAKAADKARRIKQFTAIVAAMKAAAEAK